MYNTLPVTYYFVVHHLPVTRDLCSMSFYQLPVIFFSSPEPEVFATHHHHREGATEDGAGDGQRPCPALQRCSQLEAEPARGKGPTEYSPWDLVSLM